MSSQGTAKKAAELLAQKDPLIRIPTKKEKSNLLIAFAQKNKVIYGNAFDAVRLAKDINLSDIESVTDNIQHITLIEVKSTNRENRDCNFTGHFFGLTTAELLVAQNLGNRYRFIFVNTVTGHTLELKLNEIFAKAKGIYPQWSISF
jgi:hypothetical protein